MDEAEVLGMLNGHLRDQVIAYLNGNLLKKSVVFKRFDIEFLSEITFCLEHKTFARNDFIFMEDTKYSVELFFITKGSVLLFHNKSNTFIKELSLDESFGELGFFSGKPRKASARTREFTETLILNSHTFQKLAINFPKASQVYDFFRYKIE